MLLGELDYVVLGRVFEAAQRRAPLLRLRDVADSVADWRCAAAAGARSRAGRRTIDDRNRARELIEDEAEQAAIRDILDMRAKEATLFAIRARGLSITHQTVRAICDRAGVRKRHYPEAGELIEAEAAQ
jgi:hypothetical protein